MLDDTAVFTDGVSFSYGEHEILSNVNLSISKGDCVSVVGPNGGGKTTLLKLFLGLLRPTSGIIKIFWEVPSLTRSRIGYMPQHINYDAAFPVSALDVVLMGRLRSGVLGGFFSQTDRHLAIEALRKVGLADKCRERFSHLSGGQRQRVMIARALVGDPELLLFDEPTSNLDSAVGERFYELLNQFRDRKTVIIVSHDVGFVSRFVKRVICVNREVVEHPLKEISSNVISDLYGGHVSAVRHDIDKTIDGG